MNFSDPFGLCKEGADDDCEEIVRQLREVGGTIFNAAADVYDLGDFEVHLVDGDDPRLLAAVGGNPNRDGNWRNNVLENAGTSDGAPVYLNEELDAGDVAYAAAHAALIHVNAKNRWASNTTEILSRNRAFLTSNRAIFGALPPELRRSAPNAAYDLFLRFTRNAPSVPYRQLPSVIGQICAGGRC